MKTFITFLLLLFVLSSCTRTFYIVRHAEKASAEGTATMMSKDPPLSESGKMRAKTLLETLKTKKIGYVFSTNTIRTRSTAEPTSAYFNVPIETYSPMPDSAFIQRLRTLKKNVLIVGHSNTVDDIVNKLCGTIKISADLDETKYDNLFIVKKKGRNLVFENRKYGVPSP